jgi:phosphopantothenoylcysteine synthetase/decarboxylase
MRVLVTAGNTQAPIDRVRCVTNIFTGRTGTHIALFAHTIGHDVCLLTSYPPVVAGMVAESPTSDRWAVCPFQTFDDLHRKLEDAIRSGRFDAVIHCAAVSDYVAGGIFAPTSSTHFDTATGHWTSTGDVPALVNRHAGKVKSNEPELWLRLVRAPKLIDLIRREWSFNGVLVKFKLEVGIDEATLLEIAERSRRQSDADLMVANTLEGKATSALLGPVNGTYKRVSRDELAERLFEQVERVHRERGHA